MVKRHRGGSRQGELFVRTKRPVIAIEKNHRLVQLTDTLDWTELEMRAEQIRRRKLKSRAGRPPKLRPLLGALVLMATRKMTLREAEDQIRHYAPARYLCGLTESGWTPDFTTLHDFLVLMGEEGVQLINEYVVKEAVKAKLADPSMMAADTTAQEAQIPWPNEMGLMASFMASVSGASQRAGATLKGFARRAAGVFKKAKEKLRSYRLFTKAKQARLNLLGQMANLVEDIQSQLDKTLAAVKSGTSRVSRWGKVAQAKVASLHATMKTLLPQIRYWIKTGRVAKNKIINVHLPELYAIVRGKVGKAVEFGLQWGIRRLRGGFLLATRARVRSELVDAKFALQAVRDHTALFGKPPRAYAYDRAGYSTQNLAALDRMGVKQIGLAPLGQAAWQVAGRIRQKLISERAQVEGGIGSIKSERYGFNRPGARSVEMMGACGQRAVLGFNLNKLARGLAARRDMVLVG